MPRAIRRSCLRCRTVLVQHARGRPRRLCCSDACRVAAAHFKTRLDRAIARSGLTLRQISDRLAEWEHPRCPSTLSDWRNGHSMPSRCSEASVRALELLLRLPAGDLVDETTWPVGAGGLRSGSGPADGLEQDLAYLRRRIARRLNAPSEADRLITTEVTDLCRIRAGHRRIDRDILQRVVARRDQVDRYWLIYLVEESRPAKVTAVSDCTIGEKLQGRHGVRAAELKFPTPLRRDEPHDFTYRLSYAQSATSELAVQRWVPPAHLERLVVAVEFDPSALPRRLWTSTWQHSDGPPEDTAERCLSRKHVAYLSLSNPPPGIHGFRWRP
jgi:hypothetical protein